MRRTLLWCVLFLTALAAGQGCGPNPEPDLAATLFGAARTAWLAGDYPKAEQDYQRYLRDFPKAPERLEAWRRLADIARDVRGNPGEAASVLESALLEFEKNRAVRDDLAAAAGEAWLQAKQPARAAEHLRTLLAGGSLPPEGRVRISLQLAQSLTMLEDVSGAETALRLCHQAGPTAAIAAPCSLRLAAVLLEQNKPEAARSLWKAVYENGTIDASFRAAAGFALGEEAETRHDRKAAQTWYEAVREIYPNPAVIEKKLEYLRH